MKIAGLGQWMILTAVALGGCNTSPLPPATNPAPQLSWDGTYRGIVQITGLGSGVQRQWCETNPEVILQVTSSAFTYAMPHPNTPSNFTSVYSATIAADGSFHSQTDTGTMSGKVAGNAIVGTINGSACVYSFSLTRT